MNQAEIQGLQQQIEQLCQFDLSKMLGESFPDQDVSNLSFGQFTAAEIPFYTERLTDTFKVFFQQDAIRFWDREFVWGTESVHLARIGTSIEQPRKLDIQQVIAQMIDALNARSWDQFASSLELAIGHQLSVGGWLAPIPKNQKASHRKITLLIEELNLRKEQFANLFQQIQEIKAASEETRAQRNQELQSVASELESAKGTVASISLLLQSATDSNGQITSLLSTQRENVTTANTELAGIEKQRTEITIALGDLHQKLQDSEKRLKHMQEKENWVNELAGTAAAGALGHKFEARRSQLGTASGWWLAGTVGSVVLAGAWLGLSHKFFVVHKDDVWQTLALNFGLLLPAIFIVGFFAKQFSKVRQFEEEYAFRSAVSMTLGAFADRLKNDDNESNGNEHNKLILETVEKLYKLPALLAEKRPSSGLLGKTSPIDTVKAVTDLVKQVKSPLNE